MCMDMCFLQCKMRQRIRWNTCLERTKTIKMRRKIPVKDDLFDAHLWLQLSNQLSNSLIAASCYVVKQGRKPILLDATEPQWATVMVAHYVSPLFWLY